MRAIRPLLIALALIIALDLALATPMLRRVPRDFRIPTVSTFGLAEQADAMTVDDSVSIAVVGDSIIQGLFAERDETLPYYLDKYYADRARPVRSYNFGMSAAHGLETLAATHEAVDNGRADVVVLTFNYAFYANAKTSPRYGWLYDDDSWAAPFAEDPAVARTLAARARQRTLDTRADAFLGNVWRLYGTRGYWGARFFDAMPSEAVQSAVNRWRSARIDHVKPKPAAIKLKPRQLKGKELRKMFNVPELSLAHDDARLLLTSVELAEKAGSEAVVMLTPLNYEGLAYHDALDMDRYRRNVAWMKREVESRGGTFVDLATGFPQDLIADSVHPFPAGYERLANTLAGRIEPTVAAAEAEADR